MSARISRRGFLAGSASLVAVVAALQSRRASGAPRASRIVEGPYGALHEARDLATGLPRATLLALDGKVHLPDAGDLDTIERSIVEHVRHNA